MYIIIIGCGKVGSRFAQVLSEEGHDVVIIDQDSKSFRTLDHKFNGITIVGVPIDQDVLKYAGIENADALAALTPDDNVNIMVSQLAKEIFKVPRVVARIYNPMRDYIFHHFGLETICPTKITVDVMRSMILGEKDISEHTIGNNIFTFKHQKVTEHDIGKNLNSVKIKADAVIFGVIIDGIFKFPDAKIKLGKCDILVITDKVN